jgi:hypothetical protein
MDWIDGGDVRGDGFTVRSGFNYAVYQEGELFVRLSIRRGFRGLRHLVVLPKDAFLRFEGATVDNSPAEQERMRNNFVAAMEFAGHIVE